MSIESKTSYPVSPEGIALSFSSNLLYASESTAKELADEKIKKLMEENKHLREEIKALRNIIKNISS
jgi:hypothetical protein